MIGRYFYLFVVLFLLNACTYHGQLRRGVYQAPIQPNRIFATVLVVADQSIPEKILFTEPESSSLKAYMVKTADAVAVAATDALATRFERVDAGVHTLAPQYDYVAEVTYQAGLTRTNCEEDSSSLSVRVNGLCTKMKLVLHTPQDKTPLFTASARQWDEFLLPGFPAGVKWLNQHTFSILFPILDPLYVQTQGMHVRRTLEKQLKEILQEMISKLDEKRELFSSAGRE